MTTTRPESDVEVLEGHGLHTGEPVRVVLRKRPGPLAFVQRGASATWTELRVVDLTRSTTVANEAGSVRVRTVEHLTSALAGLSIHEGLAIEVEGPELPILDGRAERWMSALAALDVAPARPRLEVAREDVIEAGRSRIELRPGAPEIAVTTAFGDARLDEHASWRHDRASYARVASARTFVFAAEIEGMIEKGLARHVPADGVVVVAPDAIHAAGAPFSRDEPVRHKLLDLIGDLHLYGGPPAGFAHVFRPGHAANHALVAKALERGSLVRRA
jgi:UDP-3-O-[3-hydroxymyristoyl] N-acetylglucosamine deacetylase